MEKFSDKKRGRPKSESKKTKLMLVQNFGLDIDIYTERGKLNTYYALIEGLWVIVDKKTQQLKHPDFFHLCAGSPKDGVRIKKTILAQLGRVAEKYGDDTALHFAKEICAQKMRTKDAIRFINAHFIEKDDDMIIFRTIQKIGRLFIDDGLTLEQVAAVCKNLNEIIKEKFKVNFDD